MINVLCAQNDNFLQFLNPPNDHPLVSQLKHLASKVLFALSQNNFTAVFNRISARLTALSTSSEDVTEYPDLELIQHINVDCIRLNKLLHGNPACFF